MDRNWSQLFFSAFLQGSRATTLARAGIAIAAVALIDWRFDVNISFGFLYLFPMLMVGGVLSRPQIALVAALCTGLSETFDSFPWSIAVGTPRLILEFAAFYGAGLYVFESVRNRRLADQHMQEIEHEIDLRREAEKQLEVLIESSPATIVTLDNAGKILRANEAAHKLLGVHPGALDGQSIGRYLPALASVPPLMGSASFFRTSMECRGRRADGEFFFAQVWFSTYGTASGPRLAALIFDASEELRDREEFSLQQLLAGSKIAVSAVCHEIRNVCGAISAVHAKLSRSPQVAGNEDFRALGNLVDGLGRMAGLELRHAGPEAESVDLHSLLEELRIIIEPAFRDSGISMEWDLPDALPAVWAERQALLQAFLNITRNARRAMERQPRRELRIRAAVEGKSVVARFIDSGPGVAAPQDLFQPFQRGAQATGLGLYLSRAFLRAFRGDVEYEPMPSGSCFAVWLNAAADFEDETQEGDDGRDSIGAPGRSRVVSGEPQPAAGH